MRLKSVRIQNYRSVKDLYFEVGDLCALIGFNNAGKSNVLNALAFVLGETWPSTRSIDPADFYAYSEDDMVITLWFDEERKVRGDVGDPVSYSGIEFRISRYKRKTGNKERGDLRSTLVCVDEDGKPVNILRRPSPQARPYSMPAPVTAEIRDTLPAVTINVDRNARYHLSGSSRSIFGRLLTDIVKELKKDVDRFKAFQEKFNEARSFLRTRAFDELERNISQELKRHTGLKDLSLQLDGLDPINIYKNFSILFKDPDTPEPIDFERMGSGVQSALVMSLLQTYRKLKKENAILLFEEPELYLHPHGRRNLFRLLKDLAASGVQTIYTTHSQEFVDLESIESVRLVYKTEQTGTEVKTPDLTKMKGDWKSQIKHLAEPKNEVFFARKVIVVEGETESLAIRRLADMMNPPLQLDLYDCSIIVAGSKSAIPTLIRILAAIEKPVLVIYDTDSDKTDSQDITVNEKRERQIQDAVGVHGLAQTFKCDPCFEAVAGMEEWRKNNKPEFMMNHLDAVKDWHGVSEGLKDLMKQIHDFVM